MVDPLLVPGAVPRLGAVELWRVVVPLRRPFRAAHGVEEDREVVLVHAIGADGVHGWGECDALRHAGYSTETVATAWDALHDDLVPSVLEGRPPVGGPAPMAAAGLDAALVDLGLRRAGVSLAAAVGATGRAVRTTTVLGLGAGAAELVDEIGRRLAAGDTSIKLKVAPAMDLDVLRVVRREFPALELAADANGSFAVEQARELLAVAAGADLAYVEQPVDPARLPELLSEGRPPLPLAVDESVATIDDLEALLRLGFGGIVNVKPARLGGVASAVAMLEQCRSAGLGAFVGGMLELGVGRAVTLALAGHPACTLPTDAGPSERYVDDDITDPLVPDRPGWVAVPRGPGIGVVPRPERLEAVAVDRMRLDGLGA